MKRLTVPPLQVGLPAAQKLFFPGVVILLFIFKKDIEITNGEEIILRCTSLLVFDFS